LVINFAHTFSSAEKLRPKSDKTMVALSAGKGIANFLHKSSAIKRGTPAKKIAARGFVRFAGQRPRAAKKPIC